MNDWQEILAVLGSSTAVNLAVLWITRLWLSERLKGAIKNEYDQKLETHKAQLQAQSSIEIEKLRGDLRIAADNQSAHLQSQLRTAALEHEIKFSRLHERRAKVIAMTYSLLTSVYDNLQQYVAIIEMAGDPPRKERQKAFIDSFNRYRNYYMRRTIFLPAATSSALETLNMEIRKTYNQFAIEVDRSGNTADFKLWNDIYQKVGGEMLIGLRSLQTDLRRLLGDNT